MIRINYKSDHKVVYVIFVSVTPETNTHTMMGRLTCSADEWSILKNLLQSDSVELEELK